MLGDGEMQEGMVWESVSVAAKYRLGNLTAIVDRNGLQQYGWPLAGRRGTGATGATLAGTDAPARAGGLRLARARDRRPRLRPDRRRLRGRRASSRRRQPTAILARTVKGRGLSFTEGRFEWHARVATADEAARRALELGEEASARDAPDA